MYSVPVPVFQFVEQPVIARTWVGEFKQIYKYCTNFLHDTVTNPGHGAPSHTNLILPGMINGFSL